MIVLLYLVALLGHGFLCVATINRVHAIGLRRPIIRLVTVISFAAMPIVPAAYAWWLWRGAAAWAGSVAGTTISWTGLAYFVVCCLGAVATTIWWIERVVLHRPPSLLRFHRSRAIFRRLRHAATTGDHAHHFLVRLLGNESLRLDLTERAIEVPHLPAALEGLSLVHISDFHFTGKVAQSYFQEVVHLANKLEPDVVFLTGDLIDKTPYIDWTPDTFGRLKARYGVYFVLGNHDTRVDTPRLRRELTRCGLIDVGGRWLLAEIRGVPVVLAGNELPWIAPAANLCDAPPPARDGGPLRIVLAHSPDQLAWAQERDADLMFAGHTHGGQIRVPLVGAIFSPTLAGVRYASGVFHRPPTILCVTRGISGELPLRLNCPPELVHLVLHVA